MNFDLTPIFQGIIALLAALITYKLIPWIKSKATEQQYENLKTAAKIAVYAAEQMFPYGDNNEKLEYAVHQLSDAGFSVDFDALRTAVEQAVYEMKGEQKYERAFTQKYETTGDTAEETTATDRSEELPFGEEEEPRQD